MKIFFTLFFLSTLFVTQAQFMKSIFKKKKKDKTVKREDVLQKNTPIIKKDTVYILTENTENKPIVKDLLTEVKKDSIRIVSGIDLENKSNKILTETKTYFSNEKINAYIYIQKEDLPEIDNHTIELKLKAIPTTLNIRFTEDIGDKVRKYIYHNRSFIVEMLTKSEYYFPMFEIELDKLNIPLELKYVSIIESHLNPKATSPMGASGLWQFMYATAKYKGMKITSFEDERRNPIVSTQYAARYFKQLYGIYDDWLLAISSYNAGAGNINKAIRATGGKMNYWIARPYMPRETQYYVPKIIALMYVMYYAEDYMLYPRSPETTFYDVTQVVVQERLTLKYIAEVIGVNVSFLAELNPMLTKGIVPSRLDGFQLTIPTNSLYLFQENEPLLHSDPYLSQENLVLEEKAIKSDNFKGTGTGKYQTYTITSGDNLGYIAGLYTCSVSDIKRWNGLRSSALRIGKKLRIYSSKKIVKTTHSKSQEDLNAKVGFSQDEINVQTCACNKHKIVSGDNLWDIAVKYNTTVEKIKNANNIYSSWRLKLGVFLKIPN